MTLALAATHRLVHFAEIDSTNAEAHRLVAAGECGPLWIWADRQTQGRGRLGRSWVSELGNLYATFLFPIAARPALASQISFVAALAVYDLAASALTSSPSSRDDDEGFSLTLKWPNDVLLDGRKFSGILPEAITRTNRQTLIALGCGINIATAPTGTPYPVTALVHYGTSTSVAGHLETLSHAMAHWLQIWNDGQGFAAIRQSWLARAIGLGGPVQAGDISGTFTGLGPDGALIVTLPSGATKSIHAGEVRFDALEQLRATA